MKNKKEIIANIENRCQAKSATQRGQDGAIRHGQKQKRRDKALIDAHIGVETWNYKKEGKTKLDNIVNIMSHLKKTNAWRLLATDLFPLFYFILALASYAFGSGLVFKLLCKMSNQLVFSLWKSTGAATFNSSYSSNKMCSYRWCAARGDESMK